MLLSMKILVTGGAGYIGSTVCSALEDAGHQPFILDSLVTGNRDFVNNRIFYQGDIANQRILAQIFRDHKEIYATIHFAVRIILPEPVSLPGLYYRENTVKSLSLFENLLNLGQKRIIFSSTASVYGEFSGFRVDEDSPVLPNNPYASSKFMAEQMLRDLCNSDNNTSVGLHAIALRYFNPIGADPKMRSGPYQPDPSHLLGRLLTCALHKQPFSITGSDYSTRDGSGLRDYVHVWDLAKAHVSALEKFDSVFRRDSYAENNESFIAINLGSGNGVTVREFVHLFMEISGVELEIGEAPRRPGDVAGVYANIGRAERLLDWKPHSTIGEGIESALAWEERFKDSSRQNRRDKLLTDSNSTVNVKLTL